MSRRDLLPALRRSAVWLFARRPVRPQRPVRRVWLLLVWVAWLVLAIWGPLIALLAAGAGILALLAALEVP